MTSVDESFPFTTTGTICYDPDRKSMKNQRWWCVCEIHNKDITRYYRWWIKKRYGIELHPPAWDPHISIIRGEEPPDHLKHRWGLYNGRKVSIQYSHVVRQSGDVPVANVHNNKIWFIDAKCSVFTDIRNGFGFPSDWNQHLSIGKVYYDVPIITKYNDV